MNHWMKEMDEQSNNCVAENSREPDRLLDDHPLEGELPTQDQAPLDIKNFGDPPPSRPDITAEETAGDTSEGTGPGAPALDQMAPKTIEDIADICIPPIGDPSLQDVSYEEEEDPSPPHTPSSLNNSVIYRPPAGDAGGDSGTKKSFAIGMEWEKIKDEEGEEILSRPKSLSSNEDKVCSFDPSHQDDIIEEEGTISLPLSLSSLNDKVTYRPPANHAGGDSGTQELYGMGMEWEKMKYEQRHEILSRPKSLSSNEDEARSRAPDELSQVRKRSISNTSKLHQIKKTNVSQFVRVNNDRLKNYEMFTSIKKDISSLQTDVVYLKIDNHEIKKKYAERQTENFALKRENSAFERDNSALKRENSALKRENSAFERENSAFERENSAFKRENFAFKRENSALETKNSALETENSALKRENSALKKEMSKLKQAHRNGPIDRECLRNDTTSFQKEVMSPKADLNASVLQDDDMAQLVTQEE